jgi:hypothetical protein
MQASPETSPRRSTADRILRFMESDAVLLLNPAGCRATVPVSFSEPGPHHICNRQWNTTNSFPPFIAVYASFQKERAVPRHRSPLRRTLAALKCPATRQGEVKALYQHNSTVYGLGIPCTPRHATAEGSCDKKSPENFSGRPGQPPKECDNVLVITYTPVSD